MATIRLLRQNKFIIPCGKRKSAVNHVQQVRKHSELASEAIVKFSNGKIMTFSTGKLARMADGSAVATLGDTSVMVTTVSESQSLGSSSFVPLTVDYKQKASAAGRIPTNFFRREIGRTEHEVLTSRLIDRSMRPLFPNNYNYQTQVMCNMLALDGTNDPDVLSINGASAALAVSDIPWNGPIGAVRVGFVDNEILINPTRHELQQSSLNLIVTAAQQNLVIMLEGSANNILLQDLMKAVKVGVKECQNIIHAIQNLQKKSGKPKRTVEPPAELSPEVLNTLKSLSETAIHDVFTNYKHDKFSRDKALSDIKNDVLNKMKENDSELNVSLATAAFSELSKNIFRSLIFKNNIRCDGRKLTDVRDIKCQVDLFKPLHGSALFQRGQTQVLCTVTLDSPDSALKMDTMTMLTSGIKEKNFFLHYEFPPYATNETGRSGPLNRREMGHGALAERGLRAVIPDDYPFTIRLTSEVMESNGSSSMASVCGGSMALMDAGVPVSAPVAGIAMGLITNYEKDTKHMHDYRILTDLLGIEDYLGDMDFKIAGTRKGITALQADIKIAGLPLKIVMDTLEQAHEGRSHIINIMNKEILSPRKEKKNNMPVTETINIPAHLRGKLMGVGGSNIKKIFLQTGVHVNYQEDSQFVLFAPNQTAMNEAKEIVDELTKHQREPTLEFGGIYTATIVEIKDIGVMITLYPGMQPTLLHNTQLDQRQVNHASALDMQVGQEIQVKYFGRDPVSGSMRISRKVLQTTNVAMKNFSNRSTLIQQAK
ncbi:polyribonucleotide nucleotidyltransferase 1, mitochondrial [Copidosoma floridanum]|uniref:polyribonucleotide nucleotidyltransferase 1, mitochondrial n=1 Tax=Copidosoma floridanum TaxID=29053 RepID=UPI0006C96BB7|nr:polyribonucleotide nucleotidyltransferase 1, mitochondrial [Copidosoma floridanum]